MMLLRVKKTTKTIILSTCFCLVSLGFFLFQHYTTEKNCSLRKYQFQQMLEFSIKDAHKMIAELDRKALYQFKYLIKPENIWMQSDFLFADSTEANLLFGKICSKKREMLTENTIESKGEIYVYTCIPKNADKIVLYYTAAEYDKQLSIKNPNLSQMCTFDKNAFLQKEVILIIVLLVIFLLLGYLKRINQDSYSIERNQEATISFLERQLETAYKKIISSETLNCVEIGFQDISVQEMIEMTKKDLERYCGFKKIDFEVEIGECECNLPSLFVNLIMFLALRRIPLMQSGGKLSISLQEENGIIFIKISDSGFYMGDQEKENEKYIKDIIKSADADMVNFTVIRDQQESGLYVQSIEIKKKTGTSSGNVVSIKGGK